MTKNMKVQTPPTARWGFVLSDEISHLGFFGGPARQIAALRALADHTDAMRVPYRANRRYIPARNVHASVVAEHLAEKGLGVSSKMGAIGAARTLEELWKKGLVAKGGEGNLTEVMWCITTAGLADLEEAERFESLCASIDTEQVAQPTC